MFLVYSLLFVAFTWPLATHFTTSFVGPGGGDANQYVWNAYNFQQQVAAGHNPWFTPRLLYPVGSSLVMHTYTPIMGLANVVLRHNILAVNLCLWLSFTLSAVGAYRLCARWVTNPVLCLLAGVAFAFTPYKLAHLPEHYHLLLTAPAPFYIYAFLEAFSFAPGRLWPRVRRWSQVLLCVVLGLLTLLSDYYTLFGLLYFSVGYAAYYTLSIGRISWRRPRTWLVLTAVFVVGHIASRLLKLAGVPDNDGFWWGGDVAGYLLPPLNNRWLGTPATAALQQSDIFSMPGSVENVMFMGYALLVVLVLSLCLPRQRQQAVAEHPEWQPLPALLLLFFLLTMPELQIFGKNILRLPTGLLHFVPFFNNIRCPTRHVSYVALLLPLVAFVPLDRWLRAHWAWRSQLAGAAVLLLVVLVEYQPNPMPLQTVAQVPRVYREAASLPGAGLFTIPFGLLDGYRQLGRVNPDELFYQTFHHKALSSAYISRVPAAAFASFDHDPVVHALLTVQTHPDTVLTTIPTSAQVAVFLQTYQPAAFVIYPDYRNTPVHRLLRELLQSQGYREESVDNYIRLRR
ncbi:hypothetical protein LGH74_14455 [Hymenobacter sp. BT178]|uniref:DUF6311 domain-containing protein n=1 Tax=Hymenobacter lucidus TaxID=2880930 RepID=A0ABS8ATX4_9BACT|nr:hypothetical protein [Hymenobacter lucidus]